MKTNHAKVSVVIPTYYNQDNIPYTYPKLVEVLRTLHEDYEIVFVDDGSGDDTLKTLKAVQKKDPRVTIVKLTRNFGAFNAVQAGLEHVSGDCVAIISADLQDPPELIAQLVEHWKNGHKVVIAAREGRDDPFISQVFSKMYYSIIRRTAFPTMPKHGFDYVLIDKRVKDQIVASSQKHASFISMIIWMGYPSKMIMYKRQKRTHGTSRWTFIKRFNLFIDTITSFSYLPIRVISLSGIVLACASVLYAVLIMYQRLANNITVEGWSALAVVILLVSGFQLFALGVIGEYLWKNFDNTNNRPRYVIDEIIRGKK